MASTLSHQGKMQYALYGYGYVTVVVNMDKAFQFKFANERRFDNTLSVDYLTKIITHNADILYDPL
jgi:hypothetical protein